MIIELFGLPGSGKTTFGNNLDKGNFIFIKSKKYSFIFKVICIFKYLIFFFWLKEIILETLKFKKWKLVRFKVSLVISTLCTFSEANSIKNNTEKNILLDEGFLQRLLSVYEEKKDIEFFQKIVKKVLLTDCVFIINFNFNIFLRYEDTRNNRKILGEDYFNNWKNVLDYNYKNILECIKLMNIDNKLFENNGN